MKLVRENGNIVVYPNPDKLIIGTDNIIDARKIFIKRMIQEYNEEIVSICDVYFDENKLMNT